jgi:hypothetical protein
MSEQTPFTELYRMLDVFARSRAMPDLTFEAPKWMLTLPVTDCFSCIVQYWMTGDLNDEQRRLLS